MSVSLSVDRFDSTPYGGLISWGVIENSPDGVFMTSTMEPVYNIEDRLEKLHATGDKVHGTDLVFRMIQADPEVMQRYRR